MNSCSCREQVKNFSAECYRPDVDAKFQHAYMRNTGMSDAGKLVRAANVFSFLSHSARILMTCRHQRAGGLCRTPWHRERSLRFFNVLLPPRQWIKHWRMDARSGCRQEKDPNVCNSGTGSDSRVWAHSNRSAVSRGIGTGRFSRRLACLAIAGVLVGYGPWAWADRDPHLSGNWNGARTRLSDKGIDFTFGLRQSGGAQHPRRLPFGHALQRPVARWVHV